MKKPSRSEGYSSHEEGGLTVDAVSQIIKSRRQAEFPGKDTINTLEIDEIEAGQHKFLGSGGSKEVYDVEINGEHYALAICGTQDSPETVIEKWKNVLKEPQNTSDIKTRGFYANDLCEIRSTKINGIKFPGLIMKRFEDHQFRILDSKNISANSNPLLNKESALDDYKMMALISPITTEVVRLIREGIRLGRDSFNLCIAGDQMHLYFNDLGLMSVGEFSEDEKQEALKDYIAWAIGAIVNSVDHDTYESNAYINGMSSLNSTLWSSLENEALQQLANQSPQS